MLRQNKAIRPYLAALLKFPSPEDASLFYDVFYTSCLKLAACWNLTKQQSMTTEVLDQCIIKTTEAYFLVKPSLANIATMHQTTYGDNVFIDGNEENAPFDLMVDVERIGQVLFKDSKSRPEMVFFDLPDVSTKPSSQQSQNQTKPTQSDGERLENDIS